MHVISGSAKVAALAMLPDKFMKGLTIDNIDKECLRVVTLTARKPQIFFIPQGFYNGAMSLEDNTKILVYSTLLFDMVKFDDKRLAWDAVSGVWEVKNR